MIRPDFGEIVGSADFVFLRPDGSRKSVRLQVGLPYKVTDGQWACPCELVGFEPRHPDIRGGDSMQALSLAISLIRRRVEDFIDKGGKILDVDDGSECPPDALWATFGSVGVAGNGGTHTRR